MTKQLGISSLEIGIRVVRVLIENPAPTTLKDIAARAGLAAPKAHRYLVSLIRAGLAEQEQVTNRYRLGPLALDLGLAALGSLDVFALGGEVIADLCSSINETALLAVWGNKGPVVVRWEEPSRPIATNVRVGWIMPILNSATGRCFAAYLPSAVTAALIEAELERGPREMTDYRAQLAVIRTRGLSCVEGTLQAGIGSVAAPVFKHDGHICAVIATLGPLPAFSTASDGAIARAVKASADLLSRRLGFDKLRNVEPHGSASRERIASRTH